MSRTIEVVIYREDDQWVAQALNVEVSSFGSTLEEACAAIQEALELYFEDEPDVDVPEVRDGHGKGLSQNLGSFTYVLDERQHSHAPP
jgi:predicted RNase H-like HicB family nuclease